MHLSNLTGLLWTRLCSRCPESSGIFKNSERPWHKTIVFRINSPGGTVGASQEIYQEIKKLRKEGFRVVVSLGDVAASGGLYVAVAGDKVVSNPGTVTGSIGVIIKSSVIKDLYKKIGIEHQVVKSGPYKDILSQSRFFTDEEKQLLQELIDVTYNQFVAAIAENRNLDVKKLKSLQTEEYSQVLRQKNTDWSMK